MKFTTALFTLLPLAAAFPLEAVVTKRDLSSDTQNDLTNGSPCKKITVIFARGTTSPGNVGTSTGPPFFEAIANLTGAANVAVQGVVYPASILGFLEGGDGPGATLMAQLAAQALVQCPNTKVVLSGYSQGGQLVHNAARQLSAATTAKISSVVIFGDPDNGSAVGTIPASKIKIICHDGDNICQGGILVLPPHTTYAMDAPAAAKFVVSLAG